MLRSLYIWRPKNGNPTAGLAPAFANAFSGRFPITPDHSSGETARSGRFLPESVDGLLRIGGRVKSDRVVGPYRIQWTDAVGSVVGSRRIRWTNHAGICMKSIVWSGTSQCHADPANSAFQEVLPYLSLQLPGLARNYDVGDVLSVIGLVLVILRGLHGCILHAGIIRWSGRQDLNLRPHGPKSLEAICAGSSQPFPQVDALMPSRRPVKEPLQHRVIWCSRPTQPSTVAPVGPMPNELGLASVRGHTSEWIIACVGASAKAKRSVH